MGSMAGAPGLIYVSSVATSSILVEIAMSYALIDEVTTLSTDSRDSLEHCTTTLVVI